MGRPRTLVMLLGAAAVRHRGAAMGHRVPGGILIGNGAAGPRSKVAAGEAVTFKVTKHRRDGP